MGAGRHTYAVMLELTLVSSLLSSEPYELSLSANTLSTSTAGSLPIRSLFVAILYLVYRNPIMQKSAVGITQDRKPPTDNTCSPSPRTSIIGCMHLNAPPLLPRGRHMRPEVYFMHKCHFNLRVGSWFVTNRLWGRHNPWSLYKHSPYGRIGIDGSEVEFEHPVYVL